MTQIGLLSRLVLFYSRQDRPGRQIMAGTLPLDYADDAARQLAERAVELLHERMEGVAGRIGEADESEAGRKSSGASAGGRRSRGVSVGPKRSAGKRFGPKTAAGGRGRERSPGSVAEPAPEGEGGEG